MQIDHINRIKHDNRIANLRLVTPKGNAENRISQSCENNPSAKLKPFQVVEIITLYKKGVSSTRLAKIYSVTDVTVLNIVRGKTWKGYLSTSRLFTEMTD